LLTIIKAYWKYILAAVLIVVAFIYGYYRGYEHEKKVLDATVVQYKAQQDIAEAHNKDVLKQQQQASDNLIKEYTNANNDLKSYYAAHPNIKWVRPSGKTSGTVSIKSESTSGTDDTAQGDLSGTNGDTPSNVSAVIDDCAADIQQLMFLQEFEKEQEGIQ